MEFFDEINGEHLLDDSDWANNYSGDNFKIANIIPGETKSYYLKISGSAGAYKITSRVNTDYAALLHKGEPNNTPAEADAQGNYQSFGADVEYVLSNPEHPPLLRRRRLVPRDAYGRSDRHRRNQTRWG